MVGELGAGAMGVVYEAVDAALERHVAIKVCQAEGEAHANRMWREAKAMARLSHPNVLTIHHVGRVCGQVYIAMELVRGGTLRRWLRTPRSWEEILDAYLQVARGLAAAHAEGLVHRDCKPDNVLLGEDGRVRVADFGLARAVEVDEEDDSVPELVSARVSVTASIPELPLTRTGSIVGTPGYAAPEQLMGGGGDARADQFSLCVSMYEAFHGERPFRGDTVPELYAEIIDGRARRPSKGTSVPRWVHAVVERGLRAEPEERFEDMDALVAALEDDPRRVRRRWVLATAAVAALGLTAVVSMSLGAPPNPCLDVGAPFDEVWGAQRAARVGERMQEVAPRIGDATLERVTAKVVGFGETWTSGRREVCEATHLRGEQSVALLDLRAACFDRALAELDGALDSLEHADAEVVARADQLFDSLTPLPSCDDTEALRAQVPLPADPDARARAQQIRNDSAALLASARARHEPTNLERAAELVEAAEALADGPTLADARLALGAVARRADRRDEARTALVAAHRVAAASGHARAAYDSALQLVGLVSSKKDADTGLDWLEVAQGWRERLSLPDYDRGRLLAVHSGFLVVIERYEDAVELFAGVADDQSLPVWARSEVANTRGVALRRLGRNEEGEQELLRAVELIREERGPDHPREAELRLELGRARVERGEYEEGIADLRQVLSVRDEVYGARSLLVAEARGEIANALRFQGRLTEAITEYEQALAMARELPSASEASLAILQTNYADTLTRARQSARGLEEGERALELARRAFGADSSKVAAIRLNLAIAYDAAQRHQEAVAHFEEAVVGLERTLGSTHPNLGVAALGMGLSLVALERWDEAEAAIARGERIFALQQGDQPHPMLAQVWMVRARMAGARTQHEAAIEARRRAVEIHQEIGSSPAQLREATYRLGTALAGAGRHGEAVEAFERAHDLVLPSRADGAAEAEILGDLARSRWETGRGRPDAIAAAERALELGAGQESEQREELEAWLRARR